MHLLNGKVGASFEMVRHSRWADEFLFRLPSCAESDKVASEDGNRGEPGGAAYAPKIGDYVQWDSRGSIAVQRA